MLLPAGVLLAHDWRMAMFKAPTFGQSHLKVFGELFPYSMHSYPDMFECVSSELPEHLRAHSDAKVIAIAQHDNKGALWGVMLMQRQGEVKWHLVTYVGRIHRIPGTQWWIPSLRLLSMPLLLPLRIRMTRNFGWRHELRRNTNNMRNSPSLDEWLAHPTG